MHYGAPQGLILHLFFIHIYCFSVQLFTRELQGIATSIILRHSFFPDVAHSSRSCCARERTLIAHKFLIKNNTEPNQSDILPVLLFMWQHLWCLFINSSICSTEHCWSFFSVSPRRGLWLSVECLGVTLPSGSMRPSWIPRGLWMAGLLWALSPPGGVVGSSVPEGAGLGTDKVPPQHASTHWCCIRPWAVRGSHGHARAGCFLGSFEPFLSYLVCIFWIPWICTLRTWPLAWVSKAGGLSEVCCSQPSLFSWWSQTSQFQLLFFTVDTMWFLLEQQQTYMQQLGRDLLPELLLSVYLTLKCDKDSRGPDLDTFSSSAFLYKKIIYFCPNSLFTSSEVGELFLVSDETFIFCIIKQCKRPHQFTDVA